MTPPDAMTVYKTLQKLGTTTGIGMGNSKPMKIKNLYLNKSEILKTGKSCRKSR